tara:strand:- start:4 stop:522 length:519 start_codon:yes stop_codon:yes gene_type:complete
MILWLTGLSGSGKTTIANEFKKIIIKDKFKFILLDGDEIRLIFGKDLGYSINDRIKQIKRIQNLTKFFQKNNLNIIVSALYSNSDLLRWNRENLKDYYQIYIKSSLQKLEEKDKNQLYSKYRKKEISQVVGMDIEWEEPINSDLVIETDKDNSPSESASILYTAFLKFKSKL